MRIDAHQHFWRPERGDYGWLTPEDHPEICRDFLPPDLAPLLAAGRIDRTILVQAAESEAETAFMLSLARQTDFIAGVVGWTDLAARDAPERINRLAGEAKLVGLRPMLQDLAQDDWILRPEVTGALRALEACDLRFDALVKPRHLPHLIRLLDRHPDLPVVIDHGAKPDIAAGGRAAWAPAMRDIAANSSAFCKLSGLANEAGPGWTSETLRPYVDLLLEAFGPARLMWGSDWPVLTEAGDYLGWLGVAETLTAHLSKADRALIFGGTAAAFYGVT